MDNAPSPQRIPASAATTSTHRSSTASSGLTGIKDLRLTDNQLDYMERHGLPPTLSAMLASHPYARDKVFLSVMPAMFRPVAAAILNNSFEGIRTGMHIDRLLGDVLKDQPFDKLEPRLRPFHPEFSKNLRAMRNSLLAERPGDYSQGYYAHALDVAAQRLLGDNNAEARTTTVATRER